MNAARDQVEKRTTEDNNRTELQNSLIQKIVHPSSNEQPEKENRTAEPRERWKQALEASSHHEWREIYNGADSPPSQPGDISRKAGR